MAFRKWYFAANLQAIEGAFDLIHAAVASARRNTALEPIFIVEDVPLSADAASKVERLSRAGVTIVRRNADIIPIVQAIFGVAASRPFTGHWLRTDIPLIETEDEFVLYTDIDVIFRTDVSQFDLRPDFIACAPENAKDDWSYFNSGVMVMNVPNLRASRDAFFEVVRTRLAEKAPHDDQWMYNLCYAGRYERLDHRMNWKPYWGFSDDAEIVHFHGPKPGLVRHFKAGRSLDGLEVYAELYDRDRGAYDAFLAEFDAYAAMPL